MCCRLCRSCPPPPDSELIWHLVRAKFMRGKAGISLPPQLDADRRPTYGDRLSAALRPVRCPSGRRLMRTCEASSSLWSGPTRHACLAIMQYRRRRRRTEHWPRPVLGRRTVRCRVGGPVRTHWPRVRPSQSSLCSAAGRMSSSN